MRLSALLHARRREAVADQGGFALAAVLAVIAFTGITIAALLGMMLTTMRVTRSQEEAAQDRRASDGALENAIEKMRDVPCNPLAQPYLDNQQIGNRTVDVSCTSSTSGVSTTDQVRLVGVDAYRGAYREWTVDCAVNAAGPGCLPWNQAGYSPVPSAAAGDVSLVHSGNEALRFDSGVTVRRGAVALRNPANGTPAIQTGGEYHQGRPGIAGSGGTDCGLLANTPAGRIIDSSGAPDCGSSEAANLEADTAANIAGLVAPSTPVSVPANCPPTPVVTFQPGTYNASQTAAVSNLTRGALPSCQNKTFWFSPGIYSFQGSELAFASNGSYYVFGVPQGWDPATGVQGNPALVSDTSSVLCDPDVSGTSIVTAGWTRLNHTRGRVAICPARPASAPDDAHPAIFQQTSVPNGVTVTSQPAVGGAVTRNFNCRAPYFNLNGDSYPTHWDIDQYGQCLPVRQYDLTMQTEGAGPVNSLRVMLTGAESSSTPNNAITARESRFELYRSNGALVCTTNWSRGMPNGGLTSSFDLRTLPGTCSAASTVIDQSNLHNGRIRVQHRMLITLPTVNQPLTVSNAEVEVNAHSGQVATSNVTSADWNNPGNVARADNTTATPRMPCNDFICQVADPGRAITPATPFRHALEMHDFEFPTLLNSTNQDPLLTELRAVIRVRPSAATLPPSWTSVFGTYINTSSFLMPSTTFIELESPAGRRCIAQGTGMNSDQEIAFDLLDPNVEESPARPGCNTFLFDHASELDDLTMRVRFDMPCIPDWLHNVPWECLRSNWLYNPADTSPVWQMRPPDIENVRLTAVSNTYANTSISTVTSNAVAGATGATFNVHGMTWMPLTDLDIAWRGPATTTPLFANDLVLNGLGSRMFTGATMGNVCCSPATSRTVELTASIDGVDRMVARVRFDDAVPAPDNRASVDVLRWLDCRGACASVLSESDTNSNAPP